MDSYPKTTYAVVTENKNGSRSIQYSHVERNAVMRAGERSAEPHVEAVTVYSYLTDDLIMGALDECINGENVVPGDNIPLHHFNAD